MTWFACPCTRPRHYPKSSFATHRVYHRLTCLGSPYMRHRQDPSNPVLPIAVYIPALQGLAAHAGGHVVTLNLRFRHPRHVAQLDLVRLLPMNDTLLSTFHDMSLPSFIPQFAMHSCTDPASEEEELTKCSTIMRRSISGLANCHAWLQCSGDGGAHVDSGGLLVRAEEWRRYRDLDDLQLAAFGICTAG